MIAQYFDALARHLLTLKNDADEHVVADVAMFSETIDEELIGDKSMPIVFVEGLNEVPWQWDNDGFVADNVAIIFNVVVATPARPLLGSNFYEHSLNVANLIDFLRQQLHGFMFAEPGVGFSNSLIISDTENETPITPGIDAFRLTYLTNLRDVTVSNQERLQTAQTQNFGILFKPTAPGATSPPQQVPITPVLCPPEASSIIELQNQMAAEAIEPIVVNEPGPQDGDLYVLVLRALFDGTLQRVGLLTQAGTCEVTIQVNGQVQTAFASLPAGTSATFTQGTATIQTGDVITATVANVASAEELVIQAELKRTL